MRKSMTMIFMTIMLLALVACGQQSVSDAGQKDEEPAIETENIVQESQTSNGEEIGIRPEFKNAMDSYEEFYKEYCEVMKKYNENPSDMLLLAEYTNLMSKATDVQEAFDAWNTDELSKEELKYYLDVNNRVMQMIVDVSE